MAMLATVSPAEKLSTEASTAPRPQGASEMKPPSAACTAVTLTATARTPAGQPGARRKSIGATVPLGTRPTQTPCDCRESATRTGLTGWYIRPSPGPK